MITTRWKDNNITDLNKAIELLTDTIVEPEDRTANITYENWEMSKALEANQRITLNCRDIEFNLIKYSYDQITLGKQPVEDRTLSKSGYIVVYNNGIAVNYIINQNSSAQKILRKMLSYTGKNEIEKNVFECDNNFLIWLISRVYNSNSEIETDADNDKVMHLEAIKGFRGDTEDQQTKVTASGESVMNIISTLSFMLESRYFNQVKVDISYPGHENISLIVQRGTIGIDTKSYQGTFEREEESSRIAKLHLLVYIEILPLLRQAYISDIQDKLWSTEKYEELLNGIAEKLTEKIKMKINFLSQPEEQEPE